MLTNPRVQQEWLAYQTVHQLYPLTILESEKQHSPDNTVFNRLTPLWSTHHCTNLTMGGIYQQDSLWTLRNAKMSSPSQDVCLGGPDSQHVRAAISNCVECAEHSTLSREPLMPTSLPRYPWQMVGVDLFQLDGVNYLLIVN